MLNLIKWQTAIENFRRPDFVNKTEIKLNEIRTENIIMQIVSRSIKEHK